MGRKGGKTDGSSIRVLIDSDPGIDDVVTLALAARAPELEIVGVTTTYGNATLDLTTRNAKEILRLAGRSDIPVYPGSDRPLQRPLVTAPETHGPSGVGYAPVPPPPPPPPPDGQTTNPTVLLDLLSRSEEPVVLVTLGPLTNLAHALTADPALVRSRVRRHIGMFGTLEARGNTNRWADFNAWCDPEAAQVVLRSELPSEMVGLDVTRQMVLSAAVVERLARSADTVVSWLAQALRFYVEFHRQRELLDGCVVNDVLTVGELLAPGLLKLAHRRLLVDLDEGDHRGHTKSARDGARARVALGVDIPRMCAVLTRVLGESWTDPH